MAELVTVSLRVDRHTRDLMRLHEEVNWSAVIRRDLRQRMQELEFKPIDKERAQRAIEDMDRLRQEGAFAKGKPGVELIREWREKRK